MSPGLYLEIPNSNNPNIFQVFSVTNGTTAQLVYVNCPINVNAGAAITAGTLAVPCGPQGLPVPTPISIANGGTGSTTKAAAQTALGLGQSALTSFANNLAQAVSFSGAFAQAGSIGFAITTPGVYLVFGFIRFSYAGVTVNSTLNFRIFDTTASAATATDKAATENVTTLTTPDVEYTIPMAVYTVTSTAALQLQANITAASLGAGALNIQSGGIVAIPLRLT